ncbi:MAG: electron transfer flavoprotein subunit beta/FixA family protein [Gammaproteobacteria bacterium]|jgi:electron transfer flavoprotein beta subunit|nr:electron transfer flavoprotein subunit beta/FixA family protein [Hellea sp.]MCH9843348.1 electron transfer flavoprotein subunit beta/FixA family protein [Gammaproteobacteria bacterium]MDA7737302.1 electron transfer flavoprotein subunit beta/FixA family protein [Porticoccus sp.]MDC0412588.1 electron transfer flavoprotein subunit beta/FixA family protein [Porticoccus sp.]MDC0888208.1 electron transfer flavoprotein subunit beta/FixA family protein [Porticoccus sp.]
MKALVSVKRVVDYNVKVSPKDDNSGVNLNNLKMSLNPFCEIAVEEAVRLKEKGVIEEILVVSIGPQEAQEQIRAALAIGADRGILVKVESDIELQPLAVAKCLKKVFDREQPDLILMGKQSIDGDNNQTGQMFAALANLPQGTFASELAVNSNHVTVTREVDGGFQTLRLTLPAVITSDLRLNEPRYASLPSIMQAKKKQIHETTPEELDVDIAPRVSVVSVDFPPERPEGVKVSSVDELLEKLKNEAKVI